MRIFTLFLLIFTATWVKAQNLNCSNGRYLDSLFDVQVTSDIIYGNNLSFDGTPVDLKLDVYEPLGDTELKRPLIIFAPKGSFLSEDKTELTQVQLCRHFASRGYVAVSIDYRVGLSFAAALQNPEKEFTLAVLRASHDYKAAIRYFRKDAYTTNTFKIDTNLVIAGGSSAGAITALHVAYLDKIQEIPTTFDTTGLGGQEGLSGNPGYSSKANFVVNLCGAIADTAWMEPGNVPVVSMHGNLDTEVPYGTAVIAVFGLQIMEVDGSASIKQRADNIGMINPFYTFYGQTHIPYDENAGGSFALYMDTVKQYITPIVHDWICGVTSVNAISSEKDTYRVSPNPFTNNFMVTGVTDSPYCEIYHVTGQFIWSGNHIGSQDFSYLPKGLYVLKIQSDKAIRTFRLMKD